MIHPYTQSSYRSFHLHPHQGSGSSVMIDRPSQAHSPNKHMHSLSQSKTCLRACCDINVPGPKRKRDLMQLLIKFQKMNIEMQNEEQLSLNDNPWKNTSYQQMDTRRISLATTNFKQQTEPSIIHEVPIQPTFKEPVKPKQSSPFRVTLREQFLKSHNFQDLSQNQQQIIWKLEQLVNKADGVTNLCTTISKMLINEQNQQSILPNYQLTQEQSDLKQGGYSLNQTLHNLNSIIDSQRESVNRSQVKSQEKSQDKNIKKQELTCSKRKFSVDSKAPISFRSYNKKTQNTTPLSKPNTDISFNQI